MTNTELPPIFLQRLQTLFPEPKLAGVIASFSQEKATAFRVNTLKTSTGELKARLMAEGINTEFLPGLADALWLPATDRQRLTHSPLLTEGLLYIQNPSSMLAAWALGAEPGEEILDLAAAPGGKTLYLACQMQNQGRIAAVEAVKPRFFRLCANLKRCGVTIAQTYLKDGRQVGRLCPGRFDRVLLDAPCSAEAGFSTRDPTTYAYWKLRKIQEMQRKQYQLLCSAIDALKNGGVLIYSTCTFAPEENEEVIHKALLQFPGELTIEPLELPLGDSQPGLTQWGSDRFHPDLVHSVRVLPDGMMEGFFICRIRKGALLS